MGNNGPELDRLWWLAAILAVGIPGLGAITVYQLHILSLQVDQDAGQSSQNTYLTTIVFALLLIGIGLLAGLLARSGYKRTKRREAALNDDLYAMPLARTAAKAERAPDVSQQPLRFYWRATPRTRFLFRFLGMPWFGFCGLMILGFLVLLVVAVAEGGDALPELITPATPPPFFLLVGFCVGIPFCIGAVRSIPTFLGKPFGVTADERGLRGRTFTGANRFLAWEDARLFEMRSGSSSSGNTYTVYYLYSDKTMIAIGTDLAQWFEPDGVSAAEMAKRLRSLEDLVLAKTGLALRTLDRSLQRPASPAMTA